MSESVHHIFKNEFLYNKDTQDEIELWQQLEEFDSYYNWNRFPIELYGYAPMEVVYGAVPDRHRFKEQIKQAQNKRYMINSSQPFCIAGRKLEDNTTCSPPTAQTAYTDELTAAIPEIS